MVNPAELTDTERVGLEMILSVQATLREHFPDSTPMQQKNFTQSLAERMREKGLVVHGLAGPDHQ